MQAGILYFFRSGGERRVLNVYCGFSLVFLGRSWSCIRRGLGWILGKVVPAGGGGHCPDPLGMPGLPVTFWDHPVQAQELHLMILVNPFQLRIFRDSMT